MNKRALKNEVFYVFIGTTTGHSAGVLNYCPWHRIPIPPFFNPIVSIYVALVTYAIAKYRLMDIKVFIRKSSLVFASAFILMGLFYYVVLFLQDFLKEHYPSYLVLIYTTAGAIILASFYFTIHHFVSRYSYILKNMRMV